MKSLHLLIAIVLFFTISGCATVLTEKANLQDSPDGVRIFPPKTYLFVNKEKKKTDIYILPDYANAYDIKPLTLVAKQTVNIEVSDSGILSKFSAEQDTTALIELIKTAADIAKEAGKSGAGMLTQNSIEGTFGLDDGIYVLSDVGIPTKIINSP